MKARIRPLKKPVNIDLQSDSKGHLSKRLKSDHYEENEGRKQTKTSRQSNPDNNKMNVYSCSAKNYQQNEKSLVVQRVVIY